MAVPIAIRSAVASYRSDHGNNDWFHFDLPVTSDTIRMACTDEYTRLFGEKAKKVDDRDKIGIVL